MPADCRTEGRADSILARRAVFLSDENRFAHGSLLSRAAKHGLYRFGLWPPVVRLRNRGCPYHLAPGDGGVAYAHSVYGSLPRLHQWVDRVFRIPTRPARRGWF